MKSNHINWIQIYWTLFSSNINQHPPSNFVFDSRAFISDPCIREFLRDVIYKFNNDGKKY